MGKGDKKTRKGKIYRGSHGNVRSHSPKSTTGQDAGKPTSHAPAKKAPAKKAPAKKAATKKSA